MQYYIIEFNENDEVCENGQIQDYEDLQDALAVAREAISSLPEGHCLKIFDLKRVILQ